ncbi:MAG: pyridoxamine 5'-phosphate oxidase family protein [Myxococcales bacterium]|nr:MAG: pyridoxamine 5'-phosphate oxidase family protein [Myxococcales bacterium]
MPAPVTTDLVWKEIEKRLFAVLSFVTPKGQARSAGIVYVVRDRVLFIGTGTDSWKAKHIARNPSVALCVNIPKRIPFLPWVKIPDATISFSATARVLPIDETDPEILDALLEGMVDDPKIREGNVVLEIRPVGDFVTYGVGVPMMDMRDPEKARGRAPV